MKSAPKLFFDRLAINVFFHEQLESSAGIFELRNSELSQVCENAKRVTCGFLQLQPSSKPAAFIRSRIDPLLKKRLCHWILKKHPASTPPTCSNCRSYPATQTHVASCSSLLENLAPDIPARFRPEALLSNGTFSPSLIALSIDAAVRSYVQHLSSCFLDNTQCKRNFMYLSFLDSTI